MALMLHMSDENFSTIELLSRARWERFLLRLARAHNLEDSEKAMGRMREVIASTTCRGCMVQYAKEIGILKCKPEFYECGYHGSQTLGAYSKEISIFRIRDILREREQEMREEDWEVANILADVKWKAEWE